MDARVKKKRRLGPSPPRLFCWGTGGAGTPRSTDGSVESERGTIGSAPLWAESEKGRRAAKKHRLSDSRLCPWEDCERRVARADNALFDHVVKDHIAPLKGAEQRLKEEKKEKEEEEDSDSDDESEDDPYSCRWPDCGKSLKRGDECRKIEWLEEHLHSRHIPAAGRFRCSKCKKFRGKTRKLVDEHEKKCGKTEKKREPRASPLLFYHPADPRPPQTRKRDAKPPVRPADCFQYAYVRPPKRHPLLADFDPAVDAHLQKTLVFKMEHNWNVRREFNPSWKNAAGSKWRKTRLPGEAYRFVVLNDEKEREEEKERERQREEAKIPYEELPQSLDDLFPPPPGFPSHSLLETMTPKRAERALRASIDAADRGHADAAVPRAVTAAAGAAATASATDAYGSVPYSPASLCTLPSEGQASCSKTLV